MERKNSSLIIAIRAIIAIIGIACATTIGYRLAQNGRYTTFGPGNGKLMLWDNWKDEPVFRNGVAWMTYEEYYTDKNK